MEQDTEKRGIWNQASFSWARSAEADPDVDVGPEYQEVPTPGDHVYGWVWENARVLFTVASMFDYLADTRGWDIYSLRFSKTEEGSILVIIKARKGGKYLVAFEGGRSFLEAFQNLEKARRREDFHWKEDQWPPSEP